MAKSMALAADSEQGHPYGGVYGTCASFGRSISSAAPTYAIEPAMAYHELLRTILDCLKLELRARLNWLEEVGLA